MFLISLFGLAVLVLSIYLSRHLITVPQSVPDLGDLSSFGYYLVSLATLMVIAIGATLTYSQVRDIKEDRSLRLLQHTLERYFENETELRRRRFVYHYMEQVNLVFASLPEGIGLFPGRDLINKRITEVAPNEQMTVGEILLLINSLNHLCMYLRASSTDIFVRYHNVLDQMWQLLKPLIDFEIAKREAGSDKESSLWYVVYFRGWAEHRGSGEYKEAFERYMKDWEFLGTETAKAEMAKKTRSSPLASFRHLS